jgi:hypothetical protein
MTASQAQDAIDRLVAMLNIAFPQLAMTFGYIGNIERWGDDRRWSVWVGGQAYGYMTTSELPNLYERMTSSPTFGRWLGTATVKAEEWRGQHLAKMAAYVAPRER